MAMVALRSARLKPVPCSTTTWTGREWVKSIAWCANSPGSEGKVYKTSCETEYGITSLSRDQVSAAQLLQLRRQHWNIETGSHYRRDVTFREDATRMTVGAAGRILATFHNLVIALIKHAGYNNTAEGRRYFDGHIAEAFDLLLTVNSRS